MMNSYDLNITDMCEILATIDRFKEERGEDPTYTQIWWHTKNSFRIDEVIAYLLIAEKMGCVERYGGVSFRHQHRGELWYLVRYPNSIEIIRGLDTIRGLTR